MSTFVFWSLHTWSHHLTTGPNNTELPVLLRVLSHDTLAVLGFTLLKPVMIVPSAHPVPACFYGCSSCLSLRHDACDRDSHLFSPSGDLS